MKFSRGEKLFDWVNIFILIVLTLFFIIPFLSVVSTSLVSGREYALRGLFILYPQRPVLNSYDMLLGQGSIVLNAYIVTVSRVVVGTGLRPDLHISIGLCALQTQAVWACAHHPVYILYHAL